MSLKVLKERYRGILLFFIDYKALLYCFTILSILISGSNILEKVIFGEEILSLRLLFDFLLPSLILFLFFTVSYRCFCGVYIFGTLLRIFLISYLLILPLLSLKFENITSELQNVRSFTSKNVWISGVVTSQEKENTFMFHSERGGLGNSLIRFKQYPVLHTGQRCKLSVKVVEPSSFKEFDYKRYLFRKGIYSILEVNEYECSNGGNIFLEMRYILERVVERSLSEPEASLLIGIMFGSKRVFRSDFNTALNSSGVSHVIAASGYNVALVGEGVERVTKGIRGKGVVLFKILCIWGFSIFSGLSSSLVRASSMTTLSLFALLIGRESNKGATLILCVTVLISLNPFIIYDVGFLFSFASVTGLIFLPKCFENIKSKFLKESILTTLTCILFTLPISVIFFGKISVISLLSNIIVLPIINSTIFWGLGVTLINMLVPIPILYLIPYIQLNMFKYFVSISSNIQMVEIGVNKYVFGIGIYLLLFFFCLYKYPVSSKNHYLKISKRYE